MHRKTINDLAIFGGEPLFSEKLHVGKPNVSNEEIFLSKVNEAFARKWLTNDGPLVKEFEQTVGKITGAKFNLAICNATVGLEILYKALDLSGEVIVPSFTFIATAHALKWLGITPVFCDISPYDHNIDPDQIQRLITPKTTGIVGVHVWGKPCQTKVLEKIARENNLKLVFDAAHAFRCSHNGIMIGNFGDAEIFSFHATKFVNSLEGGVISTNDEALAGKIAKMRNFGFSGYDQVTSVGTNGKMTEISAAMGIASLASLEDTISKNFENYQLYNQHLSPLAGIKVIEYNPDEKNNYHYIVLEIDEAETILSRDQILSIFHQEDILARRYFFPGCHRQEPYISEDRYQAVSLPRTEMAANKLLQLPTGIEISPQEIEKISGLLEFITANGREILAKLQEIPS